MLLDFVNLKNGEGALYLRLYSEIVSAVNGDKIKKGERLPSIREAAGQLGISRTTVENAYIKLCIEGIAESLPQRGYFICGKAQNAPFKKAEEKTETDMKYDFSGRKIDFTAADTDLWKKTVREVLRDTAELVSYGDAQGEWGLRSALAAYSYKARGVRTSPENIIIGAGVGPLLNILCGLIGRDNTVGIEGGFGQAELILSDYGITTERLATDNNGAKIKELEGSNSNILFLLPSRLAKISVTGLSARRNAFAAWAERKENRLIIEDDYNGELRYTARSVNAFQSKLPDKTVYIGSFSKLLLPSVRIAYMALPDSLLSRFKARSGVYNQTCGKVEQIALKSYIETGELEKHLRKLRKLYYSKSRSFYTALAEIFKNAEFTLYESSITAEVDFKIDMESREILNRASKKGIRLLPSYRKGCAGFCFAGIPDNDIKAALLELKEIF